MAAKLALSCSGRPDSSVLYQASLTFAVIVHECVRVHGVLLALGSYR